MTSIYIALNVAIIAASFFAGRAAASRGKRSAEVVSVAGVFLLFAQIALYFYPDVEVRLFPFIDYAYFRWWGMYGVALLGGAAFVVIKGRDRAAMWVFQAVASAACAYLIWQTFFGVGADFAELGFEDGVCMQSTDYTCAPASCATLLKKIGIASTEREMARHCATQPLGSAHVNIYRGLRLTLAGSDYEVILVRGRAEELAGMPVPFVANVYLYGRVLHAVTVMNVDRAAGVDIAESVRGTIMRVTFDEFARRWDGLAFCVKKKN